MFEKGERIDSPRKKDNQKEKKFSQKMTTKSNVTLNIGWLKLFVIF